MQGVIGARDSVMVVFLHFFVEVLQKRFYFGYVGRVHVSRRLSRAKRFEPQAHIVNLKELHVVELPNKGSFVGNSFDEHFFFELGDCLQDGSPGNSKPLGEVFLMKAIAGF